VAIDEVFISEPTADSMIRQKQAQLVPQLSKQLNKLDSTFQLPEGPYTFKHERQARDIMEAAYSEYRSSNFRPDQPQSPVPSSSFPPSSASNGDAQDESGLGGTAAGPDDAVIDIPHPVDSEKASGGDVDDSEVIVGNEHPEIP
jgi:hypothetical protein